MAINNKKSKLSTKPDIKSSTKQQEPQIYEKVCSPIKFEWKREENGTESVTIFDDQGNTITVTDPHALTRLHYLFSFGISLSKLKALDPTAKNEIFNKYAKEKPRKLKIIFGPDHKPISVTSDVHQTIRWSDIRREIEEAIKETCGGKTETVELGPQIAYRLPVENKYVSAWINIDPGNNLVKGRSAIYISTRFRTEYDTASKGTRPPCMNWANLWQVPVQLFGAEKEKLTTIYNIIGEDKAKNLAFRLVHITATGKLDKEKFKEDLKKFVESVEAIRIVIDKAVESPLSKAEMKAILDAYDKKVKLAKYIKEQIMNNVQEETVWGFVQAISMVRTHGQLKLKGDKDPEFSGIVRKLENIAGEVLSLCPAIASIKKQVGTITLETLIPQSAPSIKTL
jgi:hypothetical protein